MSSRDASQTVWSPDPLLNNCCHRARYYIFTRYLLGQSPQYAALASSIALQALSQAWRVIHAEVSECREHLLFSWKKLGSGESRWRSSAVTEFIQYSRSWQDLYLKIHRSYQPQPQSESRAPSPTKWNPPDFLKLNSDGLRKPSVRSLRVGTTAEKQTEEASLAEHDFNY